METGIPWIEKYRPKKFQDIIGQDQTINTLIKLLANNSLPHLLFSGPPGSGKTSTIMIISEELYKNNISLMVIKLDASDDRGITTVRDNIKSFVEKTNLFIKGVRLIILDEADSMTFDAQFALRRIIEKYSDVIRFCFICNYENKIISPIKSRCAKFRFELIDSTYIIDKLTYISFVENIKLSKNVTRIIAEYSKGDLRQSINTLQSICMYADALKHSTNENIEINDNLCYRMLEIPSKESLENIFIILTKKDQELNNKYMYIKNYLTENYYSLIKLLRELFYFLLNNNINHVNIHNIIIELAKLEFMLSKTNNDNLYIIYLIHIFNKYF